jgi:hypothetical protein
MEYPQFLVIEASSYEENAHPIMMAWSLSDGSIKSTLIQPEDHWDDWDFSLEELHGIQRDTLHQRGETAWSTIKEFEYDCNNTHYLVHHTESTTHLLEQLYDACDKEPSVELIDAKDWFPKSLNNYDSIQQFFFDTQQELGLNTHHCDETVKILLTTWVKLQEFYKDNDDIY